MEHDDISFTFKMIHLQFSTLTIILEGISLTGFWMSFPLRGNASPSLDEN
jgi:hypothetical protein